MHVEAVIVYDVEELMARLILVSSLSIHRDRAPYMLCLTLTAPTVFHQHDGSTVAMQRCAVA